MNIIHINDIDLPGNRFNGHDLQIDLNQAGHNAHHLVIEKFGTDNNTISFLGPYSLMENHQAYMNFEKRLSMNGLIYPYGQKIMKMPEFQNADVVHYHLIHNYIISLFDFADMVAAKPSVWTLHDPWAFTGHCVHPKDCEKWRTGCNNCPDLNSIFPMKHDKAAQMWNIKKNIFSQLDIDIIVASQFMLNFVKQSPLMSTFERVHLIPFGIRLEKFSSYSTKNEFRKEFGIPDDDFVISFRANTLEFKGFRYIIEMLDNLIPSKPTTILTVGQKGLLDKLKQKYNVVDLGWVTDDNLMVKFYSSCDIFLMPSTAESFGLMAIEAMASSKPVIVFEGTALQDVTFAPDCGVLVKQGDVNRFREVVEWLMANPQECKRRGKLGRKFAEEHYSYEKYLGKIFKLYEDVANRGKRLIGD